VHPNWNMHLLPGASLRWTHQNLKGFKDNLLPYATADIVWMSSSSSLSRFQFLGSTVTKKSPSVPVLFHLRPFLPLDVCCNNYEGILARLSLLTHYFRWHHVDALGVLYTRPQRLVNFVYFIDFAVYSCL
jgi:hypothetical protein